MSAADKVAQLRALSGKHAKSRIEQLEERLEVLEQTLEELPQILADAVETVQDEVRALRRDVEILKHQPKLEQHFVDGDQISNTGNMTDVNTGEQTKGGK